MSTTSKETIRQIMSFPSTIKSFSVPFFFIRTFCFKKEKKKNIHNIKRERIRQIMSFPSTINHFLFFLLLHTNQLFQERKERSYPQHQKRENSSNNELSFNNKSFSFLSSSSYEPTVSRKKRKRISTTSKERIRQIMSFPSTINHFPFFLLLHTNILFQ